MFRPRTLAAGWALTLGLVAAVPAFAQEAKPADAPSADSPAEKLKKDPNDREALNAYMSERVQAIMSQARKAPDEAEKALGELKSFLESVKPTDEQAKALAQRARAALTFLGSQIELTRVKLEEAAAKLEANPTDAKAFQRYTDKLSSELRYLADEAPAQAKEQLTKANAFLDGLQAKLGADGKVALEQTRQRLAQFSRAIDSEIARAELIGKAAPPITAEAWVNGKPLSDSDLKGKVVLLDFWAVWCGPCIQTFPHLVEWNEKYADKGLVIIGLTRYYNFKWEGDQAARAEGEVPHAEEQAMLEKFAAQHGLKHVFAVQTDNELSEFYGVTGIPQAVLIDRQGKVQMVKIGSGDENAKALAAKIEELINAPAAGE